MSVKIKSCETKKRPAMVIESSDSDTDADLELSMVRTKKEETDGFLISKIEYKSEFYKIVSEYE